MDYYFVFKPNQYCTNGQNLNYLYIQTDIITVWQSLCLLEYWNTEYQLSLRIPDKIMTTGIYIDISVVERISVSFQHNAFPSNFIVMTSIQKHVGSRFFFRKRTGSLADNSCQIRDVSFLCCYRVGFPNVS